MYYYIPTSKWTFIFCALKYKLKIDEYCTINSEQKSEYSARKLYLKVHTYSTSIIICYQILLIKDKSYMNLKQRLIPYFLERIRI